MLFILKQKNKFLFFAVLIIFNACQPSIKDGRILTSNYRQYIIDSLTINTLSKKYILKSDYDSATNKSTIYLVECDRHCVLGFRLHGSKTDSLVLPNQLIGNVEGFTIDKSIFYFLTDAYQLLSCNKQGGIYYHCFINPLPGHKIETATGDYPLEIKNNNAFFFQFDRVVLDPNTMAYYHNRCFPESIFNLKDSAYVDTSTCKYSIELFSKNFYYDCLVRTINNNNQIVYGLNFCDWLFIYNIKTGQTIIKHATSPYFFTNTIFDNSKIMNYDYIEKYSDENSQFGDIYGVPTFVRTYLS